MKILILNWRDIKNPQSGGAEVLTHEIAKRWVKWGHQVTQFSAAFSGCQPEEEIDGVKFIRRGSPDILSFTLPVHFFAFWHYWYHWRGKFDVIVDEIHGIPFFTPFYVKEKKIAFICEVAKEIWDKMFSFPWNLVGRGLEKFYFKIYHQTPFLTISVSTRDDLVKASIPEKNITVLPMGVTLSLPRKLPTKNRQPTLIFVGRLCRMKGISDAIMAFQKISQKIPLAKFWIIGSGEEEYLSELKKLVVQKKLKNKIKFWGFVSESEKFKLLAKAHLLLHPSSREGWGLVVHEANSVKTPVIAYNSPGLRDIIKDRTNGLLCGQNQPSEMSRLAIKVLENKSLYRQLQIGGQKEVKKADWDKTAKTALAALEKL